MLIWVAFIAYEMTLKTMNMTIYCFHNKKYIYFSKDINLVSGKALDFSIYICCYDYPD